MDRRIRIEDLEVVAHGKLDVNRIEIEIYHSKDERRYVLTVNPCKHGEHFRTYVLMSGLRARIADCKRYSRAELERLSKCLDPYYVAAMINQIIEKYDLEVVSKSRFPFTNSVGGSHAA